MVLAIMDVKNHTFKKLRSHKTFLGRLRLVQPRKQCFFKFHMKWLPLGYCYKAGSGQLVWSWPEKILTLKLPDQVHISGL